MSGFFWAYMLVMALLLPVSMIAFGRWFEKGGPRKINGTVGYRTRRSMLSQETWVYAHRFFGRLWWILGWVLLPISVVVMIFFWGKDVETIGWAGLGVMMVQMVFLLLPMILTERALRARFDDFGRPRSH